MKHSEIRYYTPKKKSTFILDPKSYHAALKDPFELKELESYNMVKAHIENFKKLVVMTSHGKDSLVLTHMVCMASRELKMEDKIEYWLNNTLNLYPEEKDFWALFNKWLGIEKQFRIFIPPKLPNGKQATVWSVAEYYHEMPTFRHLAKSKKTKSGNIPHCCNWLKKKAVKTHMTLFPIDSRVDCKFIGERGQESLNRRVTILQRCRTYTVTTREAYPIRIVKPLAFWEEFDVWEYHKKYGFPKHPTYENHHLKRMGCASCPAYIGWEIEQAKDPSRHAMLKENLKRLLEYGQIERYNEAISNLREHRLMPELWGQTTLV